MLTNRNPRRIVATLAATLTLALSVTACGGDDTSADPSAVETASNGDVFNGADVDFATEMIPHHAQALEMVEMTEGRTLSPEFEQLATQIKEAQTPEIETMTGWLTAWGKDVPDASGGHGMGDMGDMGDMPGMMSSGEMGDLDGAADSAFEDMWMTMMIRHHEGAIEMAKVEQAEGDFADAIALAKSIESSQQTEIATMQRMLDS